MNALERSSFVNLTVDLDRANIDADLLGRAARRHLSWSRRLQLAAIGIGTAIALPVTYSIVLFDAWNPFGLSVHQVSELAMHSLCNLLVAMGSFTASGRIEGKLARVITGAFTLHAAVTVAVTLSGNAVTRLAFVLALCISICLCVAIICALQSPRLRRVAAIGTEVSPELQKWFGARIDVVRDTAVDLREYNLILFDLERPPTAAWTTSLTRAILAGTEISHPAEYLERACGRASPDHFNFDPLQMKVSGAVYAPVKRMLDIAVVVLATPAALLIIGAAACAIALREGGPVLFIQDRVGQGGKLFRMYKLRTMLPHSRNEGTCATAKNDVRITPLGHFLRRCRIDELPQLWNVLRGDMSLIGPRPEQPKLAREYARQMPAYWFRHLVRPGISGWAQVSCGYAANYEETREKLTYDLHYIKHFGFALDMRIAVKTVFALISGVSAR